MCLFLTPCLNREALAVKGGLAPLLSTRSSALLRETAGTQTQCWGNVHLTELQKMKVILQV